MQEEFKQEKQDHFVDQEQDRCYVQRRQYRTQWKKADQGHTKETGIWSLLPGRQANSMQHCVDYVLFNQKFYIPLIH